VSGTTIYNLPSESVAAYYSEPRFSTRDLPPLPVTSHTDGPSDNTAMEIISGGIDDESQISDGISSDCSPSSSQVKAPYSRLESSTREPPPAPVVYDRLVKPVYVNTSTDLVNDTSGVMSNEGETDSAISVSPSSEVGSSYSGLEPSTREPPPAPVVYDRLVKPVYVNTVTALTNDGIMFDGGETDSVISSEVAASYCGMESSTRGAPTAPVACDILYKPIGGITNGIYFVTNSQMIPEFQDVMEMETKL